MKDFLLYLPILWVRAGIDGDDEIAVLGVNEAIKLILGYKLLTKMLNIIKFCVIIIISKR